MYTSTIPGQMQSSSQSYQSGIHAFPVGMRSAMSGNTFTYSFNPMISSSSMGSGSWAYSPSWSQGWSGWINPSFSSQAYSSGYGNPSWGSSHFSPSQQIMQQPQLLHQTQALQQAQALQQSQAFQQAQALQHAQAFQSGLSSGQFSYNPQLHSGLSQLQVDLAETNSDVVVAAALPNVNLNDVNLTVTEDSMSITATAWTGSSSAFVYRTVALPTTIKSDQVDATFNNGILEIRAPKSDVITRQKVKVNIS